MRLEPAAAVPAVRRRRARPRPGKVELYSERLAARGLPPLPTWTPLIEGPDDAALAGRYPLQCIVPPNRFFLNSSFSQSERLRRRQGTPDRDAGAGRRRRRAGSPTATAVQVESARGARPSFTARVTDATRAGVAVIEGVWWHRFHPGGLGVNVLTDDRVDRHGRRPRPALEPGRGHSNPLT